MRVDLQGLPDEIIPDLEVVLRDQYDDSENPDAVRALITYQVVARRPRWARSASVVFVYLYSWGESYGNLGSQRYTCIHLRCVFHPNTEGFIPLPETNA